jgi:hypothetical protein
LTQTTTCKALLGLVLAWALIVPTLLRAQPATADAAYADVANWLFDLYLNRSIQISVVNANRLRPGAEQLLQPQMPAMARVLDRHREPFVAALRPALQLHVPMQEITKLQAATQTASVELDDEARARLVEVDQEFRREQQSVIRALTGDLNVVIGEALAQAKTQQ